MMRGNPQNLRQLEARLRKIASPAIAERIAREAAGALTARIQSDFDAGNSAYGTGRESGVHGAVSLRRSGGLRSGLSFRSIGRLVRCVLSVPYAKYMVGRFAVLPMGAIPWAWQEELAAISKRVLSEMLGGA